MSEPVGEDGAAGKAGVHPGQAAVLGVRVLRNSGVQALSMAGASLLHLVNLFVVADFLGPADLGRFAILYFGANLLGQILSIAVKPGTIRRTFGAGDDEGDDDDEEEEASASPERSLGAGLMLGVILAVAGVGITILLREPIASGLLGSSDDSELVVWTALLGGATVLSRLTSIVVWFERRPVAFLVCELSRPFLTLVLVIALLAGGAGLEAVLMGGAIGTAAAAVVGFIALRHSFIPSLGAEDVRGIFQVAGLRAPIMMSFWTMSNADVFLLSRYVTDTDLGIYTLASRVGLIAAFLPQGFRVAMRPLRKATIFKAVEKQYGRAEQRGQLLGYFLLLCVSAILAMVLVGDIVVEIAPDEFGDAAPLIPLTAAGMVAPALLRTVNQQTNWPSRGKPTFIACALGCAAVFIAGTMLLAPEIGNYAAPVAMIAGMLLPSLYLFIRGQRGPDSIRFPYRELGIAVGLAMVTGGAFSLVSGLPVVAEVAVAIALGGAYVVGLILLRAVPQTHWDAFMHMARTVLSGRPDQFKPRLGLRALNQRERDALRAAVTASWAAGAKARAAAADNGHELPNHRLVKCLRRAGVRGGVDVPGPTELDGEIGAYLFSSEPTAVRNAAMRKLLTDGAEAHDLRVLEDLVAHLAAAPPEAWTVGRRRS